MSDEIRNFKITKTMLGVEDHGILTASICLEGNSSCCWWGGYALDEPIFSEGGRANGKFKGRQGTDYGMEFIRLLLSTLGVEKWEDLPGTFCRGRKTGDGFGVIDQVGHITEEKWFDPKHDLKHLVKEK